MNNQVNTKIIEEKAEFIFGFKRYVEKRYYCKTAEEFKVVDYKCYLLSVIFGDAEMSLMLAPKGTNLICIKIPDDGKYGYNEADYVPLVVGHRYVVIDSSLSECFNSKKIEGCGENRYDSFWFKIENPLTKDEAIKLYGESFESDYADAVEYYNSVDKKKIIDDKISNILFIEKVRNFNKSNLESGDIVVYNSGSLGVVIKDIGIIVMQNGGYDCIEDIEDDMTIMEDRIEKVYRGVHSFCEYEEGQLVYDRSVL